MIRAKFLLSLVLGPALAAAVVAAPAGQSLPSGDLSGKVLPSVVSLAIQKPDGRTASGAGFLTVRDGLLATAWSLVSDARGVVAKFPNGEEFECSGVVDKDGRRNAALVRIKVFGRPILKMEPVELASGAPVAVAAVKDGAFGLLAAAAGEAVVADGVKLIRLSGDVPEGTTGSPVVDAAGNVVGMVETRTAEGRTEAFIVPAAYLLGLDASLPTQPWGAGAPSAATPAPEANLMALDEVDARLGRALQALIDDEICLSWAHERTTGYGFLSGVPDPVYEMQQGLDLATAALSEARTDSELRRTIGRAIMQMLANQKAASENFIRSVVMGQQAKTWGAQSQDAQKRALSLRQTVTAQIAGLKDDLLALEAESARFREFLPRGQRYALGLAARPAGFTLGVTTYPRNPFYLLIVATESLAHQIGLRPGDRILSAAGRAFTAEDDIEDFKLLIKANLGKTVPAVVERNGKTQDIRLKIPKEIPKDALTLP